MSDKATRSDSYSAIISLSYSDVFTGDQPEKFEDLLKGIPSVVLLEMVGHFLALMHTRERDPKIQQKILAIWSSRFTAEQLAPINSFFQRNQKKGELLPFNNLSLLHFCQEILINYNDENARDLTPEEEFRSFKAYCLATDIWLKKQNEYSEKHPKFDSIETLPQWLLPFDLPQSELLEFKDFRFQLIKAIYFFRYIEGSDLSEYLDAFISKYNLNNWNEYLLHLVGIYATLFDGEQNRSVIVIQESMPDVIDFLNSIAIDPANYKPKRDFLGLRSTPVYKKYENEFLILNYNFFIDKIFQGIQFEFAKILIDSGVVKDFGDFKSRYFSEDFSETVLFNSVMNHIASNSACTKLDGKEIEEAIGEKGPDYYIRCRNNLYVFEFKDILFGAGPKFSYDWNSIHNELTRKLVENEKGKAKGVGQLAKFISGINADGLSWDKFNAKKVRVYPILVITDQTFGRVGFNKVLNTEFRIALGDSKQVGSVNNLTVIQLDTMLKFQDYFHDGKLRPQQLLDNYRGAFNKTKNFWDRFKSFDKYLHEFMDNNDLYDQPHPRILSEFLPSLFSA